MSLMMRTAPRFPRVWPLSALLLALVVSLFSVSVLHSDDASRVFGLV